MCCSAFLVLSLPTPVLAGATTPVLAGATTPVLAGATTPVLAGATTPVLAGATTPVLAGATTCRRHADCDMQIMAGLIVLPLCAVGCVS
jgi:hypothetical protein